MAKTYFEQKKGTTQSIFVDENGRLHSALPATPKNVELRLETPKNLKNWATMTFVFPHADIDCDPSSKAAPINDTIVNLIRHNLAVCDHDERSLKKTGDTYSVSIGLSPRSKPEDLEGYRIKFAEFFVKRIYADHKADFKPAQQQQNPQPAQPAPERLKPGCNPTGMLLTQLSQKASVDEYNRIRRLCGVPERQFILDDGTVYPPTI